jgi:hypothetical protein
MNALQYMLNCNPSEDSVYIHVEGNLSVVFLLCYFISRARGNHSNTLFPGVFIRILRQKSIHL